VVLCVKVYRRDYEKVKSSLKRDRDYLPYVEGDFLYVPVKEGKEAIQCDPPRREERRLNYFVKGVRGYYVLGHVAVIREREGVDVFKVAELILRLNRRVKSVFVKERVEGEFRVNRLRLILGEDNTRVRFKENGLTFEADLREVFVDPTMGGFRGEILKWKGERFLDVFTGYGAAALHMAKVGSYVVAGDLNLMGVKLALHNAKLNKLDGKMDFVQYDASKLPFREGVFERCLADNPTSLTAFVEEVCRVCKSTIALILDREPPRGWKVVTDYSKDLFIYQGPLSCHKHEVESDTLSQLLHESPVQVPGRPIGLNPDGG